MATHTPPKKPIESLPPMARVPEQYYESLSDVQFDKLSLYYFYRAHFKQRFVILCFAIDNQMIVRLQPGYDEKITQKKLSEEKEFYADAKQEELGRFFRPEESFNADSIRFSVAVFGSPGVVHQQLLDRIEEFETPLFAKTTDHAPIGLSFYKYFQDANTTATISTNRSGWNKKVKRVKSMIDTSLKI